MAYLARIETHNAMPMARPMLVPVEHRAADFATREWAVIRDARRDALWTVRPFGLARRWWNRLSGRSNPKLASERLEALRTVAVLSWQFGYQIAGEDVAAFVAAGFSLDHYELLVTRIQASQRSPRTRFVTEAQA